MKKYLFLLTLLLLIGAHEASAAIAFDAVSSTTTAGATSISATQTIAAASNEILWVGVLADHNNTSGTYNGASLYPTINYAVVGDSGRYLSLYCLASPASGSHQLTITASSSELIQLYAVSYSGAAQNCHPDAIATAQVSSTALTMNVTTTVANAWTLMVDRTKQGSIAAGTGTVSRVQSGFTAMFDSSGTIATPRNATLTATAGSGQLNGIMISFVPFITNPTTSAIFFSGN
jgi:hypothetical protein